MQVDFEELINKVFGDNWISLLHENEDDFFICLHDTKRIVRYISDSVQTILGYSPQEIINREGFQIMKLLDRKTVLSLYYEVIRENREVFGEYEAWDKDGKSLILNGYAMPVNFNGRVIGCISLLGNSNVIRENAIILSKAKAEILKRIA